MADAPALDCNELVEIITDYLEGAMAAEERARFDAHVERCGGCRNYLEQMRFTIRTSGRLTEESLSAEAKESLLAAFRGWKK